MADATQVEMMVLNLAINARDAMPDGGSLKIGTAVRTIGGDQELADGDYVEISVRDDGMGMDEATLRRAMEPFFTTKPLGKGTGLGLAQIYGSARQAGGTVRIDSALGSGTTVRVLLPCTERQPVAATRAPKAAAGRALHPATILLVDDDHDLRLVLAEALTAHGYGVLQAVDGATALSVLETECPDMAVLDFAMPDMNGAELARHLAELCPDLPVLFASGFSDTDAIEAAVGSNAPMLRKPFRIDELLHAVADMLERSRADADDVPQATAP
jgi:CheY-like chemotaxis protein